MVSLIKGKLAEIATGLPGYWYVACPDAQLSDRPHAIQVAGHRLQVSRERDGRLATDGTLELCEQNGYVWAWLPGAPGDRALPMPEALSPDWTWTRLTLPVESGFMDAIENTLDLVHPLYVHPYTHPVWWMHRLGIRPRLTVRYQATPTGWTADGFLLGRRIMWQEYVLPDRVRLVMLPDTPFAVDAIVHHVPETATRSRFEYLLGRRCQPWERTRIIDQPRPWWLHRQDQDILEALTRNRGEDFVEQHGPADVYTLFFRKIMRLAAEGRWTSEWERHAAPQELVMPL